MTLALASLAIGLVFGAVIGYALALLQRIERAAIKNHSGMKRESTLSALSRAIHEDAPIPSQPAQVISPSKKAASSLSDIENE
jgi:hypothetical protein